MDCINAMGEVISIEDVDDIGGSCFTYIRVSVHGIPLGTGIPLGNDIPLGTGVGAVAVGDTFIFSVAKKIILDLSAPLSSRHSSEDVRTSAQHLSLSLISDSVCLTHVVPYYRCIRGVGDEDQSTEKFLSNLRYPRM